MSLWESGDSTGAVSLRDVLGGGVSRAPQSQTTGHRIAELIVRGGWPMSIGLPIEDARTYATDYLDLLVDADLSRVAGYSRDPVKVRRLLRSLARNVASESPSPH
ncbi:hypothetical protein EXU48_22655 [Occultella glacieicola]|uniref:Uncharacterized protein n=1 Tax=Occultella glacieicola TaxID=2518684 RepID=A0ABY2DX34_9MICO|nr:hypothetical protein EXU48_22655 [Occultella glacieicola]